jgi:hypothetical protein
MSFLWPSLTNFNEAVDNVAIDSSLTTTAIEDKDETNSYDAENLMIT